VEVGSMTRQRLMYKRRSLSWSYIRKERDGRSAGLKSTTKEHSC